MIGDTSGGDDGGGGSSGDGDGDGSGGEGKGGEGGGDFCGFSQGAGEDADAECNLDGSGDTTNEGDTFVADGDDESDGVEGVDLARTGFDVGVLALFGGIALACGIALLLVQRRRIS